MKIPRTPLVRNCIITNLVLLFVLLLAYCMIAVMSVAYGVAYKGDENAFGMTLAIGMTFVSGGGLVLYGLKYTLMDFLPDVDTVTTPGKVAISDLSEAQKAVYRLSLDGLMRQCQVFEPSEEMRERAMLSALAEPP